mgnify:CR=1 FL=1|tara:strand:+ start:8088 stop:8747 length:660 start_codon:yes stop_codon:yes gene_type:complete
MKENAIFLGHLGLGDHIICQGIVNSLSTLYDEFYVICKPQNVASVKHMCKKLRNVFTIEASDDHQAVIETLLFDGNCIKVGSFGEDWYYMPESFDEVFYRQVGMNISDSFNWKIEDGDHSKHVLRKLYPERDFCFVHDDPSRGFHINPNTELPIVRNVIQSETVFDYMPLLREASEIHCMDSSFALMIDRSDIEENLFLHRSIRKEHGVPTYQKKWKIV